MSGASDQLGPYLKRTEPGRGHGIPDDGERGVPRVKSIPNVPTERLHHAQSFLHEAYHTPEGLHEFDDPRNTLIQQGSRGRMIKHELHLRGESPRIEDCRFCS